MARGGRGSRGSFTRGRGRGRGRSRGGRTQARDAFRSSRLQDVESDAESPSEDDIDVHEEPQEPSEPSDSEDEEISSKQSYATLLQVLNAHRTPDEPPRKKRKTQQNGLQYKDDAVAKDQPEADDVGRDSEIEVADAGLGEVLEDEEDQNVEDEIGSDDDDDVTLQDPFENHYGRVQEEALAQSVSAVKAKKRELQNVKIGDDLRKTTFIYTGQPTKGDLAVKHAKDLHLKKRLFENGSKIVKKLSAEEKELAQGIFSYRDVQYGRRTVENAETLRDLASLHALNHVFKTRDRILKNNAKSSQQEDDESGNLRDQGFTRPKVLIIVPTKQSCARFVDSIARISEADQQENKSRFLESFTREDDDETWRNKPKDFQELFGGNNEEDFRVGLKFTRKTIKFFSGFYNSDIIFSSALGLMKTITTGGGSSKSRDTKKKKSHDADFLSSIEVVVVDHAAAIQMQNWQHLEYIFSQMNILPKDSHGCDFGRVRNWYLDGNAQYLRQTILFTSHHTPEINALFSRHTHNIKGLARYTPIYTGAMLNIPLTLPFTPTQTFLRIDSGKSIATADLDSNVRFTYFTTTIVPQLTRTHKSNSSNNTTASGGSGSGSGNGVLIIIPSYADFTRIRNYLSTSASTTSLSFGSISEYTENKESARARSYFATARHSVLLYTERAHHHFRYRIKGVKKLFFYGCPENPIFWSEFLDMLVDHHKHFSLNLDDNNSIKSKSRGSEHFTSAHGKGVVRALFSKWDALKLERIVGTDRIGRMVSDRNNSAAGGGGGSGGDVFEFI